MNSTHAEALAYFDQAYAAFLAAFAEVPDAALGFVPAGDEYALGVLPLHLQHPQQDYMAVLSQMVRADFAQVDLSRDAEGEASKARRHEQLAQQRPTAADRKDLLLGLESTHQETRSRLAALDAVTFARSAPVIYSTGAAPYPTSARDIVGWLSDHYQEHTGQTHAMLVQWRATKP
jgi:hypothetical protein